MGKQKMRVREVVPADLAESVIIPNDSIRVSKTTYEDLHYKVEEKEKEKEKEKEIEKELKEVKEEEEEKEEKEEEKEE